MSTGLIDPFDDDTPAAPKPAAHAPAPVSAVTPVAASPLHQLLEFAGIALISAALTAGLVVWRLGPRETPTPTNVLTVAAQSYMKTLPAAYHQVGERVRSGELKTIEAYRNALKAHAKPLADAQEDAAKARTTDKGEITDAAGLASDLESVSVGLAKGVK